MTEPVSDYDGEIGDSFMVGEIWTSPRGTKYKVEDVRFPKGGGSRKIAIIMTEKRRKLVRGWDEVDGWVRNPDDN